MKKFILYTAEACHLCERALAQIELVAALDEHVVMELDIATDIELIKQFGNKVPVFTLSGSEHHLYWPFDHYGVIDWLNKIND